VKFLRSNFLWSWRGGVAVAALLLILFLFRPGVYELRNRIANSIGSALGRKVAIDNVRLRLLPRPGFDLEGLVIYDDPAFSAEPMIRAQEVSAAIRIRSLLRGRLEIATLSATEPSINLVRNSEGHWNLASLVERNALIPAAPTGKPPSERRPAFPYLEASNARVNFKIGQTKKSYALTDADVALWQDSENSWAARIKAQPVRTDFHLTDTGQLQISATWQRAASLALTPVQLAVQWQNGQLGQISTLLSGKDRGWRGGVNFSARFSGTPQALRIESQTIVANFHRYDIVDRENVRLAARCSGQYNAVEGFLDDLLCESPVNGGLLRLSGGAILNTRPPGYNLTISVVKVPLTSVVRLLRQAKKQIPNDLTASGLLSGEFLVRSSHRSVLNSIINGRLDALPLWSGTGSATDVRLLFNTGKDEIAFGTIPLTLMSADVHRDKPAYPRTKEQADQEPAESHLNIGPITLSINTSAPVKTGGWISAAGYNLFLRGDMELKDLFRLEDVMGLPVTRPAAEGSAKLDVSVSGSWQGFAPANTTGTAQLRSVHAEMRGLNTPIEIASATVTLSPDTASLQRILARTGTTHWSGSVTAPRRCAAPNPVPGIVLGLIPTCQFQFDLSADQLSTGDLTEWFTPHSAKRPWYRILNPDSNSNNLSSPSPLFTIRARGNLHVARFGLKKVIATQVSTQVDVDRGKVVLTNLQGQLLQGTHRGDWTIDATNNNVSDRTVQYHGTGTLQNISLEQVGAVMNDAWINGTADGSFDIEGSSDSFRDVPTRSVGKLRFEMGNGALPLIEIPGSAGPLRVHRFAGELRLKKGTWEIPDGRLEARGGVYQVSGTASPTNGFDFVLTRGDDQSFTLTGPLAKPHVAQINHSEAKHMVADANTVNP
jgi:hypothetical protein